jgi:excisionase family DNA binding protein
MAARRNEMVTDRFSPEQVTHAAPDLADVLDYGGASRLLGIGVSTLYAMVCRRTVPFYRLGPRLVRFSRKRLVEWMEARAVAVGAEPTHER